MNYQNPQRKEQQKIVFQFKSGVNWFFWIALLSLVNSIAFFLDKSWGFVIGLGITRIIDDLVPELVQQVGPGGKLIALIFDLVAAGFFVILGLLAKKRYYSGFIVGMSLYTIDGLLFLLVRDWLSIAFHVIALFYIYKGYRAAKILDRIA